jgi:hypothetical protein
MVNECFLAQELCQSKVQSLTHDLCHTYDHGIRLSNYIQFCHLKFRQKL